VTRKTRRHCGTPVHDDSNRRAPYTSLHYPQDRSDAADPPFWTTAPPPIDPLPVRAARTRSSDDLARIAVTTLLAWAAGRCGEAGVTTARVAAAIARSWPLVTQDVTRAARVQLALRARDGSRLSWLDDAPLGPLARGLSGTIVRAADPGDAEPAADSLALSIRLELHRGREWVSAGRSLIRGPSRLLSPEPCGQSLYGRPIDAGRAILTRQDGTGSTIIDARGRVTLAPRWPEPILAEGPLDADGTWFAWSMTPPRLLVHDAGNRIVHDIALPFTPISAEVEDDGLRFAALDGVWRWTANGGIVRVVETPPLVAAWTMPGGGLDLAWLPPQDRPRQRTDRHFSWSLEEGLREHAPPPLGPCWSRSVHEGWTAEALPDANLVRISDVSGLRGWVISDYPRTVTWAGGSLVIVISGGEVSLVPGVRAALA